jgi:hypothetical protein
MADIPSKLHQPVTDNKATHIRPKRSVTSPEREEFIFTAQVKVIPTGNYLKYIIKDPDVMSDKRRFCGSSSETIQRVNPSCSKLAQNGYKHRHIGAKFSIRNWRNNHCLGEPHSPNYECESRIALENYSYKLYTNHTFLTGKNVPFNRKDKTMADKPNKEVAFIDT